MISLCYIFLENFFVILEISNIVSRDVAIKVCGKQHTFFACVEGFRFETTVMSLLEHPNIMKCYGANEKSSEPFIVMPLCRKYY